MSGSEKVLAGRTAVVTGASSGIGPCNRQNGLLRPVPMFS